MDRNKIQELLQARAQAEQELQRMRSPVTILFSDIKGSTAYFEKKGDLEGLAMIERHNRLLNPIIEEHNGRIVKTIGDSIMACFQDPVAAVAAAVAMQQALETDRAGRPLEEHIHIRVGLHTGVGLVKDNDIYGDVVNAASRVQHQAQPDQILITDVLLEAAKRAGVQCARLGRAEMKGKDEPIDIYAVAWSATNDQLVEELETQFERKLREAKRRQTELEEEFENARDQWRAERRRLMDQIEELELAVEQAKEEARRQTMDELHSELRFKLEEAVQARQQSEAALIAEQTKWETERASLKEQLAAAQASVIEAIERSNNPARSELAMREQIELHLAEARQDWQMQWEAERRRLNAEIERLRKSGREGGAEDPREAARRALLQKLGKAPSAPAPDAKTAEQWQKELEDVKMQFDIEREQLELKLRKLERQSQQSTDEIRNQAYRELRAQYEPKIEELSRERRRLAEELERVSAQFEEDRRRMSARIDQLEQALPDAQEATRKQVVAELQAEFEGKLEEANRLRIRAERRLQDDAEEWEAERRRARKQISQLEEELKEAKGATLRARRGAPQPTLSD